MVGFDFTAAGNFDNGRSPCDRDEIAQEMPFDYNNKHQVKT